MSNYKPATHKGLKDEFIKQTKLVLKKEISKNPVTLENSKQKIVVAYNLYIDYINNHFEKLEPISKSDTKVEINYLRDKLQNYYDALGIKNEIPGQLLEEIDLSKLPDVSKIAIESSDEDNDLGEQLVTADTDKDNNPADVLTDPNNLAQSTSSGSNAKIDSNKPTENVTNPSSGENSKGASVNTSKQDSTKSK